MTTKLETIATKIKATTCLHDLLRELVEFETEARRDAGEELGNGEFTRNSDVNTESLLEYHGIDLCALPTFGGTEPRNTDGLWSYDEYRVLVGEGPFKDWEIFDRDDESQAWRA